MAAAPFGGRWEGWAERRADARSVMCMYRFDADRRSARTGFHELGAGAGLIGYPRRPRRAGACLRQASRNGPRNPRDPDRNLYGGRVERPVSRPRRLIVLMCGLSPLRAA